jgi:rod shape-determining protein MreD
MINQIYRYIIQFFIIVALQVMVLNNVQYTAGINPYLYVLFILMLPFEIPDWLLLVIAFATGLTIDIFSDSIGLHAASTSMMAFLRPYALKIVTPNDGYRSNTFPSIRYYGLEWFIKYTIGLVVIHHTFFVFFEAFSFSDLFRSILTIVVMTLFTMTLVILSQYIFFKK